MQAVRRAGSLWEKPERTLDAVWPHVWRWWLMAFGLAPAAAVVIDFFRPRSGRRAARARGARSERVRARRERRARKAVGAPKPERRPVGFELGRHVDGDRLLPTTRDRVPMPLARLEKTVLVIGAPGSGKTETLLRLAQGVATASDWCVFVLDAKGDQHTQQRFAALMHRAGRTAAPVSGRAVRRLARHGARDRQPARAADRLGRRRRRHLLPRPLGQPRPRRLPGPGRPAALVDRAAGPARPGRLTEMWAGQARAASDRRVQGRARRRLSPALRRLLRRHATASSTAAGPSRTQTPATYSSTSSCTARRPASSAAS